MLAAIACGLGYAVWLLSAPDANSRALAFSLARDLASLAAAGPGDLLIGGAAETQLELVGPVAAIDEMGVAIDQSRRDPAAFEIVHVAGDVAGIPGQIGGAGAGQFDALSVGGTASLAGALTAVFGEPGQVPLPGAARPDPLGILAQAGFDPPVFGVLDS